MLARSTRLQHPCGAVCDLPKLVPSFSSKGFPFIVRKKRILSETTNAIELVGPFLDDTLLVSAYDLYHQHFVRPERFFKNAELLFVDSGGYELAPDFNSTEPKHPKYTPKEFSLDNYREVLNRLPSGPRYVVANYDWSEKGAEIEDQILAAQEFFQSYRSSLSSFIVKPPPYSGRKKGRRSVVQIDSVVAHVGKLRAFDIVGLTENELGKNLVDRLKALAKLRVAMDRESVNVPIQIWGGLDPVITPLYFFAGAEIFDGLSWLRYAYHQGTAVYRDASAVLGHGIELSLDHVRALTLNQNLIFLQQLTTSLRRFAAEFPNFGAFEWHANEFERAYSVLQTKIPELKELKNG